MAGSLEMITSATDFAALQAAGRSRSHPLLALRYRPNGAARTRFGISTGRRIGGAVVRNRVRRRLRTVLRQIAASLPAGWDILLVCRPPAATASQAELGAALERLLAQAGISGPATPTEASTR
ncbi:MAG TPA: ribonuclease P protein component [Candidatus Limnocylindrales bacterium]